jgi:dTDP-4-amino-4,6-dideoxygalactose transaminase
MNALWNLARRHQLYVIEDAAHAVGAEYNGWPIGAGNPELGHQSDAVAFSFYATKNLTTGEGGMVTAHDDVLADEMRVRCLHGISRDAWNRYSDRGNWYYDVLVSGFKYNLSDLQSAIGLHQLKKLDDFIATRERYAALYSELFVDCDEVTVPPTRRDSRHAWHLYMLRLNLDLLEIDRDRFITELRQQGVGTSVHFIPIPLHPFFAPFAEKPQNRCPRALELYRRLVSLPLYPGMTEEQVRYVADTVRHVSRAARRRRLVAIAVGRE